MNTTTTPTDIQYLIGQEFSAEYIHQEQERELREALAADYEGYDDWSEDLNTDTFTEGDVDNFAIINGALHYKGEGTHYRRSISGIEV